MYIIVEHEIEDNDAFQQAVREGMANLPSHLRVHQVLPAADAPRVVCLWEADGVEAVRAFLEPALASISRNTYMPVAADAAVGLPATART